jgi:translocator assembly and maintenance protein 41
MTHHKSELRWFTPHKHDQLGGGADPGAGRVIPARGLHLVFAVDDPLAWHEQNLEHNPQHYSVLKYLGAANVAAFQENFGAGVYYNTLVGIDAGYRVVVPGRLTIANTLQVPLKGKLLGTRLIKYGVVSTKTLCEDLRTWKTLYLSGRMHKPVRKPRLWGGSTHD